MGDSDQLGSIPKSFAVVTILTRDIFGYLFVGLVFIVTVELLFKIFQQLQPFTSSGTTNSIFVAVASIAVAYPIGRFLNIVGAVLISIIQPLRMVSVYERKFVELNNLYGIPLQPREAYGIDVNACSARMIFGRVLTGWSLIERPDLFYTVSRPNTLRLLAETTLGLVIVTGFLLTAFIEYTPLKSATEVWWLAGVFFILLIIVTGAGVVRMRDSQAEVEILTIFMLMSECDVWKDLTNDEMQERDDLLKKEIFTTDPFKPLAIGTSVLITVIALFLIFRSKHDVFGGYLLAIGFTSLAYVGVRKLFSWRAPANKSPGDDQAAKTQQLPNEDVAMPEGEMDNPPGERADKNRPQNQ